MNKHCILIHYHELALKKDNKVWFERVLQKNIKLHLTKLPVTNINTYASRVFIYGIDEKKWDDYSQKLKNVMGLKNAILMQKVDAKMHLIQDIANNISSNVKFDTLSIFNIYFRQIYKNRLFKILLILLFN